MRFNRLIFLTTFLSGIIVLLPRAGRGGPIPTGDATISAPFGSSGIVIHSGARVGAAIDSLRWNGKEFIDAWDHGRELQTAWNGNAGIDPADAETFNPTEGGSRDNDRGPTSLSRVLELHAEGNRLETYSQPAFWLKPGETSEGKPARNKSIVSEDRLRKRVVIGINGLSNAIDYKVTVTLAAKDHNTSCVIEALTGYMPPEFDRFWAFDPKTGRIKLVDSGPAADSLPLIFSTADAKYAMGAFSPGPASPRDGNGPTYARWSFKDARVVKWNCVYRVQDPKGLAGDFDYQVYVAVGTLEDVRKTLAILASIHR